MQTKNKVLASEKFSSRAVVQGTQENTHSRTQEVLHSSKRPMDVMRTIATETAEISGTVMHIVLSGAGSFLGRAGHGLAMGVKNCVMKLFGKR